MAFLHEEKLKPLLEEIGSDILLFQIPTQIVWLALAISRNASDTADYHLSCRESYVAPDYRLHGSKCYQWTAK
jgi:hypothetical protein